MRQLVLFVIFVADLLYEYPIMYVLEHNKQHSLRYVWYKTYIL